MPSLVDILSLILLASIASAHTVSYRTINGMFLIKSVLQATITWFEPSWSTITTACGRKYPPQNDAYFAAVSVFSLSDQTSILNSNVCGSCIRLTSGPRSTLVTVVDVMMRSNANADDIDLSNAAFMALDENGSLDSGVIHGIQWDWADCNGGTPPPPPPPPPPAPAPSPPPPPPPSPSPEVPVPSPDPPAPAPVTEEVPPVPVPNPIPTQESTLDANPSTTDAEVSSTSITTVESQATSTIASSSSAAPIAKKAVASTTTATPTSEASGLFGSTAAFLIATFLFA
ncbi:hypothetical protein BDR26DRAFT_929785 [Obelidium mucronatum]|nr:hypothetical protein BDR26DRAFT_929785 [Obelidium mucronatum]